MSTPRFSADINIWGLGWVAVAIGITLGGAWAVPKMVTWAPFGVEQHIGHMLDTQSLGSDCAVAHEPAWQDLLTLVARLYPQSASEAQAPITVHLVHNSQINAFATLGGHVFILTGLLDNVQSPDELAGVLAHELEHVSRRHLLRHLAEDVAYTTVLLALVGDDAAASSIAKTADYWSGLHFTRAQESEADAGAVRRMRQAGISLTGLIEFFARLGDGPQVPTWASDHPGIEARLAMLKATPSYAATPAMAWSRWQAVKTLCAPTAQAKPKT